MQQFERTFTRSRYSSTWRTRPGYMHARTPRLRTISLLARWRVRTFWSRLIAKALRCSEGRSTTTMRPSPLSQAMHRHIFSRTSMLSLSPINCWLSVTASLSAFLAEVTFFPMYLDAALDSLDFISAHLTTQSLIQNGISASQDTPCVLDDITNSFSTGLMLQGLAVLNSIRTNASTQALQVHIDRLIFLDVEGLFYRRLDNMIEATMSNTERQTSDGIIAQGSGYLLKQGHKFSMRGLVAAYTRNSTSPDLRPYLHGDIGVQLNAVIDLATSGGNDIYAGTWIGPQARYSTNRTRPTQSARFSVVYRSMIPNPHPATRPCPQVPHLCFLRRQDVPSR
ncbi:hypothetical protein B0H19DRAFT_1154554 [Mycena capillaripes]|nr:hypothetical protein B0H19DRAFT_1154554 [Mycena capillaripes]